MGQKLTSCKRFLLSNTIDDIKPFTDPGRDGRLGGYEKFFIRDPLSKMIMGGHPNSGVSGPNQTIACFIAIPTRWAAARHQLGIPKIDTKTRLFTDSREIGRNNAIYGRVGSGRTSGAVGRRSGVRPSRETFRVV